MSQRPSIGRVVHYVSRGSADGVFPPRHVPLHVVEVGVDDVISGWTLNPSGIRYETDVPHDEKQTGGTWHWPERVD